jgi:hypothetical protein
LWSDSEADARSGEAKARAAVSERRRTRRLRPPPREEGSIPPAARSEDEEEAVASFRSGWPERAAASRFHCGFGRSLIYLWDLLAVDTDKQMGRTGKFSDSMPS